MVLKKSGQLTEIFFAIHLFEILDIFYNSQIIEEGKDGEGGEEPEKDLKSIILETLDIIIENIPTSDPVMPIIFKQVKKYFEKARDLVQKSEVKKLIDKSK